MEQSSSKNSCKYNSFIPRVLLAAWSSQQHNPIFYKRNSLQAKRDNNKKTGAKPKPLDAIDNLVLDILGRDSAAIDGIVRDSVSFPQAADAMPAAETFMGILKENTETHVLTLTSRAPEGSAAAGSDVTASSAPIASFKRRRHWPTAPAQPADDVGALRIKRFRLQIRKLELEILKLENEMGVEHIDMD